MSFPEKLSLKIERTETRAKYENFISICDGDSFRSDFRLSNWFFFCSNKKKTQKVVTMLIVKSILFELERRWNAEFRSWEISLKEFIYKKNQLLTHYSWAPSTISPRNLSHHYLRKSTNILKLIGLEDISREIKYHSWYKYKCKYFCNVIWVASALFFLS